MFHAIFIKYKISVFDWRIMYEAIYEVKIFFISHCQLIPLPIMGPILEIDVQYFLNKLSTVIGRVIGCCMYLHMTK